MLFPGTVTRNTIISITKVAEPTLSIQLVPDSGHAPTKQVEEELESGATCLCTGSVKSEQSEEQSVLHKNQSTPTRGYSQAAVEIKPEDISNEPDRLVTADTVDTFQQNVRKKWDETLVIMDDIQTIGEINSARTPELTGEDEESPLQGEYKSTATPRRSVSSVAFGPSVGRRLTLTTAALRLGMQARITARVTERTRSQKVRRRRQEKRQDQKAAKTLSAILLAFIITWTPYNVFTVITPFCEDCINPTLYAFG